MKDFLTDIVSHTLPLGNISLIKITGDATGTKIDALADNQSVIVKAEFKTANPDFTGTFGIPNLGNLNTILNIPEYKENANISMIMENRNGETIPTGIHFENANGDFSNDFRLMSKDVINAKLKGVKFAGVNWDISFEPAVASIQRFKFMSSANPAEKLFRVKTDGNNLKFFFGDTSTHAGNFVFQSQVAGKMTNNWTWFVDNFYTILLMYGDKTVNFSDQGMCMITVDSGLIKYDFILPAQS